MTGVNELESNDPPAQLQYVDNGILFFISNKMNFMTHDDIVYICKDFYSESDIHEAKKLMYEKFDKQDQAKIHRGANKSLNDLKEMVSFMSQQPAPKIKFCITKCTQIPSVCLDYVDAAALGSHVTKLRGDMMISSATLSRLIARMDTMENSLGDILENQKSICDQRQKKQQQQNTHKEKGKEEHLNVDSIRQNRESKNSGNIEKMISSLREGQHINRRPSSQKIRVAHTSEDEDTSTSNSDEEWQIQRHQVKKLRRLAERQARPRYRQMPGRNQRSVIVGTKAGTGVAAARPVRDVALFVSRLSPDVDPEALRTHVEEIAGVRGSTECEKLEQRHPNYVSFKVSIKGYPKDKIAELYKSENWHQDVLVKRWFN